MPSRSYVLSFIIYLLSALTLFLFTRVNTIQKIKKKNKETVTGTERQIRFATRCIPVAFLVAKCPSTSRDEIGKVHPMIVFFLD